MAYDGSLTFDTAIDPSGFNKGTTSLSKQANALKGTFASLGKVIGSAFAVTQLIKFGREAVNLASDIQEVQNVVDTAFGDMKYKMESFAETAIDLYGISKLTAKQTGSTFMAMATGMNLASETASDMSLQLTALSADMASFYNKTQEVTSTALKSVFTGETETLKQFGIVMTEANLEAFRLSQGIEKSYKKMSQAEKVALRYNYVMHQTRLAQGDFTKTQDSWANQTRILSERWKEFLSILGNGLVKVLTPVVKVLNTALQYLIVFGNVISKLLGWETKGQEAISNAIGSSVENQEALTDATKETAKANKKTLASFDEIQKLTSSTEAKAETGAGIGFEIATPYELEFEAQNIDIELEKIKSKLDGFNLYLGDTLKTSFISTFTELKETVYLVFTDLFTSTLPKVFETVNRYVVPFYGQLLDNIIQTLAVGFQALNAVFQNLWTSGIHPTINKLIKIWDEAWQTIYKAWQKWGSPIFENLKIAITNFSNNFQLMWYTYLKPIWDKFMAVVDELWVAHLKPLWDNIADFIGELINGALEIYNKFISPIVTGLVKILGPAFASVFGSILDKVGTVIGIIIDAINGVITTLKGIIQFIVGVFTLDWEKAWDGIGNVFKGTWDRIANIVKGAINLVIGYINGMITALESGLNMIIRMINTLSFDVPDWVPGIGGEVWGFNIPQVKFGKIPKLATGTVVPANYGEFTAILGDNKRETEIVSPLSTMKQALIEALAESGQNITIKFEESSIGDLVRMLKPYIAKENRRVGSTMRVTGGAY